ncbi:MAG: undecaprenyl-diphosphate phosphatase, partial [Anaerolineales bacterium]|nr:undecaprenyl-diphosphate phosphatase [Anaerolineales bacterium]
IPISSSAHLIIVPWLFQWNDPGLAFDVALHLGTLVALLVFFARDWLRLIRAGIASIVERKIGDDVDRRLAWWLVIGSIPGAIAGVLFESKIEELFHAPNAQHNTGAMIAMGVIIALLGAALFVAERIARHTRALKHVSLKDAILIGCAQALALFPGVSRSGATITAGLALGLEREVAARFSFLLSAPIIAGAGAKSVFGLIRDGIAPSELIFFGVGFVSAAISGYLCIKFLLRFLQRNSTDVFVYYRWLLAALVIGVAVMR